MSAPDTERLDAMVRRLGRELKAAREQTETLREALWRYREYFGHAFKGRQP